MKRFTALFIFIFCAIHYQNAQSIDKQWYIYNKRGLHGHALTQNGIDPNNINDRPQIWTNEIDNRFQITGVSAPHDLRQKEDDIFMILNGGQEFFLSRNTNNVWKFTSTNPGELPIAFDNNSNIESIEYMYYANLYDIDDPPSRVIVNNSLTNSPNSIFSTSFNTDDDEDYNKFLKSSVDAIPGHDVTIIIYVEAFNRSTFKLRYNGITTRSNINPNGSIKNTSKIVRNDSLFTSSDLFEGEYIYPKPQSQELLGGVSRISLDHIPNYIFVNLRATNVLNDFASSDEYSVVFELLDPDDNVVAYHTDPTRLIRDPNHVVASDICTDCKTILYHGQFYNKTEHFASGLAFEFDFPNIVKASTAKITEIKVNNNVVGIKGQSIRGQKISVELPDSLKIRSKYRGEILEIGKVEFTICANLKDNVSNYEIHNENLLIQNGLSFFNFQDDPSSGRTSYPLSPYDTIEVDLTDGRHRVLNQHCLACDVLCVMHPDTCKWYNCFSFWLIDYRWIYAILGMGLIGSILYYLLQKDKH